MRLDSAPDPVVYVPCTFFIGENGVPLEVVAGFLEAREFLEKIDQVEQVREITRGA